MAVNFSVARYNDFMQPAARYILYGQVCFYVGLILCVILKPHGLAANAGISYYGDYKLTILPYTLALLGSAIFTIRAAQNLHNQEIIKNVLLAISVLTIGILLTPDAWSRTSADVHTIFGIILFSLQLLLSFYLIWKLHFRWQAIALTGLEVAAGISAFIWLAPPTGLLLQAQAVFQVAFAGLLLYTLQRLQ